MEIKDPIEEARRYVANADEIIQKSGLDMDTLLYKDKKYVCIAGFDYANAIIDRCALLHPGK